MPYTAVVGQILLRHRERLGLNQNDLASALGISQPAYSRIEQGGTTITVGQLRKIGLRFRIAPSLILRDVEALVGRLRQQGVEVTDDKQVPQAALLVALGILAAIGLTLSSSG
jgi:transcriptional regulator with XRE-family HTH domain